MTNKAVTYIDLLGFSECVRNNPEEAVMMLSHFNTILSQLNFERIVHPSSGYVPALQNLARRNSNESFEDFPFLGNHNSNSQCNSHLLCGLGMGSS